MNQIECRNLVGEGVSAAVVGHSRILEYSIHLCGYSNNTRIRCSNLVSVLISHKMAPAE